MKNVRLILVLLIICGITYWSVTKYFDGKKIRALNKAFYSSNISGKLDYCKEEYSGVVFKLVNGSEEYLFYPYASKINEMTSFSEIAEEGDMIIKRAHSDTLKLVKKRKEYLYTSRLVTIQL